MSDLGKRLAEGDDAAFTEVVEQYSRRVYALCYRLLRDEEEARDMAQEVFVRVYTKRRSFRGKSQIYTWIYRIALNTCFSALKHRMPPTVPLEDVEPVLAAGGAVGTVTGSVVGVGGEASTGAAGSADCPEEAAHLADMEARVAAALEHLPPKQRSVFALRFYDRLTFAEIAEAMGTSIGAAKANFHFAVEHLRRLVREVDAP